MQLIDQLVSVRRALVFVALLPGCFSYLMECAYGGDEPWRTGQGEVIISHMTPEQARARAFDLARSQAVESGMREISSVKLLLEDDTASIFCSRISSRVHTRILREDTLLDTIVLGSFEGSMVATHIAKIRAQVHVDETTERSSYGFYFRLNKEHFIEGDAMEVSVQLARDSYIHIFNITADNRVLMLFPTSANPQRMLAGGKLFTYPDDRAALRVYPLEGNTESVEEIRIVVTKKPLFFSFVDLDTSYGGEGFIDLSEMDLATLETHIAAVPFNERSDSTITYTVRARYNNGPDPGDR